MRRDGQFHTTSPSAPTPPQAGPPANGTELVNRGAIFLFDEIRDVDIMLSRQDPERVHVLRRGDGIRIGRPGRPITDHPCSYDYARARVLIDRPATRGALFVTVV